jgi:ABC-type lipoprotein export system ATPase subunit
MIRISDLHFRYPGNGFELRVPSLSVSEGSRICLTGASGSGKTTLVNIISGILKPASGTVAVAGREISRRNDRENRAFRIGNIGYIFQNFELLDYLPVEENVLLPFTLSRRMRPDAAVRARMHAFLEQMGIAGKKRSLPGQLSQGEKQRVAICRAVITEPSLIIADEPTANLDRDNAGRVMGLIESVLDRNRATFLMVSHDPAFRGFFDDVVDMGGINAAADGDAGGESLAAAGSGGTHA